MGPPIFIGGKRLSAHRRRQTCKQLQWGHRFSSVESLNRSQTRPRTGSFNGATDFHRWKVWRTARYVDRVVRSFNGATDFHRWKVRDAHHNVVCGDLFNGATDFHRWKGATAMYTCVPCSHLFNGATDFHRWKEDAAAPMHHLPRTASMGPPIFIGGKRGARKILKLTQAASMGPPIFIGGKARGAVQILCISCGFNGATDFHRWKVANAGPI